MHRFPFPADINLTGDIEEPSEKHQHILIHIWNLDIETEVQKQTYLNWFDLAQTYQDVYELHRCSSYHLFIKKFKA